MDTVLQVSGIVFWLSLGILLVAETLYRAQRRAWLRERARDRESEMMDHEGGEREWEAQEAANPFRVGDMVMLGGDNPWVGWIEAGETYEVGGILGDRIRIAAAPDKPGAYVRASHFVIARLMPDRDGKALEYEEAMAGQEMIDDLGH